MPKKRERAEEKTLYEADVAKLEHNIGTWNDLFCIVDEGKRKQAYARMIAKGEDLVNKYAWAIPNKRALNIAAAFSPLVEVMTPTAPRPSIKNTNAPCQVGAGIGYWSAELMAMGVDVNAYDIIVDEPDALWNKALRKGGPEVLRLKENIGRTLFLCYPDEANSLALECLDTLDESVQYVVHVGELLQTGTFCVNPAEDVSTEQPFTQRPWGRTSSSKFQEALAARFHCVIQAEIPRFPHSRDAITVWKRTQFTSVHSAMTTEARNSKKKRVKDSKKSAVIQWAAIPIEERLSSDIAAPRFKYLL